MAGLPQILLAALVVTVTPPKDAPGGKVDDAATAFYAEYAISYLGLPVGSTTFRSSFKDDRFAMEGSMASAGLARIFDSTEASVKVGGAIGGKQPRPESYLLSYTSGDKQKSTRLVFKRGNVAEVENVPPLKKRGGSWVPVRRTHLSSVIDPMSAALVSAPSLAAVCPRTIKVFDGELRADLVLSEPSLSTVDSSAYSGETVTCRARFVPVAGYRSDNRSIAYLRDRSAITITFAPLAKTGVYAPIRASVGTQIGPVSVDLRRLEAR